jgi:GAF domain-containing protein
MQTGQPIFDRVEYIERAAVSSWCSVTRLPLRDDAGTVIGVIGIGRDISDHVQSEKRERTSTQDLKAVVEIADRLISSTDLDTLLRKAVELARSLLRVERCSILLNRDDHLIGTYGTDINGRTTDERDKIIPMDSAWENRFRMWDRKTSQWIIERDIQRSSPDARANQARNFWVATTPIKGTQNRMIGVFCNDCVISGNPPDEHLQDVIAVFCSLLGNIIERQRSMDEIKSRDQVLDGVARSSSQLLLLDDIDPAIQESLRLLGESMGVNRACIFKNHQNTLTGEWHMRQRYEWTQHPAQPSISDDRLQDLAYLPDFQEMFEHLSNGRISDGETSRLPPSPRRLFESLQIISFLRVPIHINNRFWGFIGFDDAQVNRTWSANEKTILLAMAGNLGGAISRELTERELKSRDRILSGVAKANHELLTNPDVELAISQALRTLAPAVNADRIFLCENHRDTHRDPHGDDPPPSVHQVNRGAPDLL